MRVVREGQECVPHAGFLHLKIQDDLMRNKRDFGWVSE